MADLYGNSFMMGLSVDGGDEDMCTPDPVSTEVCEEQAEDLVCDAPEVAEEQAEQLTCETELTREERLEAATISREGMEGRLAALPNLDEAQRAQLQRRVEGLEGDDLIREMELIEHALKSPNADRALNTLADLDKMTADDEDAQGRLTPEVVAMLVHGVADSRTTSTRGQEGVLGRKQALESAKLLVEMGDDDYAATMGVLGQAGKDADGNAIEGADAGVEQSLILKAMAARHEQIDEGFFEGIGRWFGMETDTDTALAEVSTFAQDIRGMKRDDLIRQTTLMDIDDVNTSTLDPEHPMANNDTQVDNDGLYQRFTDSCAPTSSQILRGEIDPAFALKVHRDGLNNADPTTETAEQQRAILESHGGGAVSRLGKDARTNLDTALDTQETNGTLNADERDLVERMAKGDTLDEADTAAAATALQKVRDQNGGHPTDVELKAIQFNQGKHADGMNYADALDDLVQPLTGIDYERVAVTDGNIGNDLDNVDRLLRDGEDVPFRIAWDGGGAHAMSITDMRTTDSGTREYLVTDPYMGATRWVDEATMKSGDFKGVFPDLGNGNIPHLLRETKPNP